MNTHTENTITVQTSTFGPLTLNVMGNRRERWGCASKMTCRLITGEFEFSFGGIDYDCTAEFGHYRSTRGLEPLRLEHTSMTRKGGLGGPTENARIALWKVMDEVRDQLRTLETFERVWGLACSDAEDQVLREKERAIQELEQKLRDLNAERDVYERMGQQPPASAIA